MIQDFTYSGFGSICWGIMQLAHPVFLRSSDVPQHLLQGFLYSLDSHFLELAALSGTVEATSNWCVSMRKAGLDMYSCSLITTPWEVPSILLRMGFSPLRSRPVDIPVAGNNEALVPAVLTVAGSLGPSLNDSWSLIIRKELGEGLSTVHYKFRPQSKPLKPNQLRESGLWYSD